MQSQLPPSIKENQESVPGGDLRLTGNSWLRKAFDDARCIRVPREAEVRRVIGQLTNILDICPFDLAPNTFSIV